MSGEVPERPKGTDCKSVGVSLRRFESSPLHRRDGRAGIAQLARASAFQAEGRGFESRFPLFGRPPISAHLLRCSVARLCGVASATPPRSLPRALQLDASRRPARSWRLDGCGASRATDWIRSPMLKAERAQVAQSAEHVLGKDEVGGSIPLLGFREGSRPRAERVGIGL